jgi:hypothetical protein
MQDVHNVGHRSVDQQQQGLIPALLELLLPRHPQRQRVLPAQVDASVLPRQQQLDAHVATAFHSR